jgi:hypothetical protein
MFNLQCESNPCVLLLHLIYWTIGIDIFSFNMLGFVSKEYIDFSLPIIHNGTSRKNVDNAEIKSYLSLIVAEKCFFFLLKSKSA